MSFSSDPAMQSNQLALDVEFDKEKEEFNDVLNLQYRRIVDSMNTKVGGLYQLQELNTFKQVYGFDQTGAPSPQTFRNVYRTCIDVIGFGSPQPSVLFSFPFPAFSAVVNLLILYCSCKNSAGLLFTLTAPNLSISNVPIGGNNVFIINPSGAPLVQCLLVAEYMKN